MISEFNKYLISSICSQPKLKKRDVIKINDNPKFNECGEDSYFSNDRCIGICDGVGGWNNYYVNPALIARQMCLNANDFSKQILDPLEIMEYSYKKIINNNEIECGSTTCCILSIHNNVIISANIGDSGYIIIRDNKVVFTSNIHRDGNTSTKQLAVIPKRFSKLDCIKNNPDESIIDTFTVENNDIIIMATDGLWDNICDIDNICIIVSNLDINLIAKELIKIALNNYEKPDDITVIVSKIIS